MADQTINIRFKNKYDTEESWIKNNPVLLNGELAFSSDKQGYYKIGNGKSSWSDLKYAFYNNIVDLSVNGRTITYQRVDGSKGSFTTQDTNTVYGVVNENNNGLMTPTLFTKLNNIQDGANKYVLPVASNTVLGGVKIGANLTNSSGTISLTKTNIVSALGYTPPTTNTTYGLATSTANGLIKIGYAANGKNYPVVLDSEGKAYVNVPWTDTNTTYTLGSFGVTASASELNYVKGVTSNIQTQLNSKAPANHSHGYLPLTGGTLTGDLAGQYITGTWLKTTSATNLNATSQKIAVLDGQGWIYFRTPAEIRSDIGAATSSHTHAYLPLSGGTVTGKTTFQQDVVVGNKVTMHYNTTTESLDFIFT